MSYNVISTFSIIVDADMSQPVVSKVIPLLNQDNVGIQLSWTGSPTGSFDFAVSFDHLEDAQGNVRIAGSWASIPLNPAITASGSPDTAVADLNQLPARYLRVTYMPTSGSGVLNAVTTGKGI